MSREEDAVANGARDREEEWEGGREGAPLSLGRKQTTSARSVAEQSEKRETQVGGGGAQH